MSDEEYPLKYIQYLENLLIEGQMLMEEMRSLPDTKLCGKFLIDCVDAKNYLVMKIRYIK